MPRCKIANWTTIRDLGSTTAAEEVEVQAVELARQHVEEEVAAFERKGEVAQDAMKVVMEEAVAVAVNVVVGKMHAAVARTVVEAVAMEAAMAALRTIRYDTAMVSLEAVAKEAAKVTVRELREGVIAKEAEAEAQMYIDDAATEEARVTTGALVGAGRSSTWLLVDGDEMEVEDNDEDEEAEAKAERDAEMHAADAVIREIATEAAERATH
jgi:hypothetical protein